MNSTNNIPSTLLKAILLASVIFWTLILSDGNMNEPFIILAIIPISIVCSLTILVTIVPFYSIEQRMLSNDKIFKKYFPCYSIISFCIAIYCIIKSNFNEFVCIFFITAFFTLMQSWIWICKMPVDVKSNINPKSDYYDKIQ